MIYAKLLDTADNSITWCRGDQVLIDEMVRLYNDMGMISVQVSEMREAMPQDVEGLDDLDEIFADNFDEACEAFNEGASSTYFIIYGGDEI